VDDRPHKLPMGWVIQENGCWDWVGTKNSRGYGTMWDSGMPGRRIGAHRVGYERVKGPIPAGLTIDHLCRNPSCGNPDHLEAVTLMENIRRGNWPRAGPGQRTHCNYGHPLSGDNLYVETSRAHPYKSRRCRICQRANGKKKRSKRRPYFVARCDCGWRGRRWVGLGSPCPKCGKKPHAYSPTPRSAR